MIDDVVAHAGSITPATARLPEKSPCNLDTCNAMVHGRERKRSVIIND